MKRYSLSVKPILRTDYKKYFDLLQQLEQTEKDIELLREVAEDKNISIGLRERVREKLGRSIYQRETLRINIKGANNGD